MLSRHLMSLYKFEGLLFSDERLKAKKKVISEKLLRKKVDENKMIDDFFPMKYLRSEIKNSM
jgi:hypothetical protein